MRTIALRLRRFTIASLAVAAALVALVPAPARATHATGESAPGPAWLMGGGVSLSLDASVGLVEGTATEIAFSYPHGRKFKLSELTWDLKDVVMAGVRGSVNVGRRVRVTLGVRSALTEGAGMMVDRDWDYPDAISASLEPDGRNWTHESRHPDTSLDRGTIVDLNVSVLGLQAGPFSLYGIVGYKQDTWNWSARGGTYRYSYEGFRDLTGEFPAGVLIITYEQQYSIPYVGIGASWTRPAVALEAQLLVSPAVSASDSDYHVLRNVLFEGDFSGGTYVGLGLDATWAFAPHWIAVLGVHYQSIPQITGDVTINGEEGYGIYRGGGGIAMSATSVALGAEYRY